MNFPGEAEIHCPIEVPSMLNSARECINSLFDIKRKINRVQCQKVEDLNFGGEEEEAAVQAECQKMINYLFEKFPTAAPKPE
jgi:hypothetical protein